MLKNLSKLLNCQHNWLTHTFRNAYDNDSRLTQVTDPTGTYQFTFDSLGRLAATSTQYDSFGKLTGSSGSLTNPFQYTGRESDAETGLYYYRARYYDPSVGRFISQDPIGFDGGVNYYAYAFNKPVDFADPTGQQKVYPHNMIGPLQPGDVRGYIVDLDNNKALSPLLKDFHKHAPTFYGLDHECVSLTRHFAPALPCMRCWRAGPRVVDTDIPRGTAIATFTSGDENGRYPSADRNSGLFVGYNLGADYSVGIDIIDQFPTPPTTAGVRELPNEYHGRGEIRANSAKAYYVITVPPGTTPGGCDCAN